MNIFFFKRNIVCTNSVYVRTSIVKGMNRKKPFSHKVKKNHPITKNNMALAEISRSCQSKQ